MEHVDAFLNNVSSYLFFNAGNMLIFYIYSVGKLENQALRKVCRHFSVGQVNWKMIYHVFA